MSKPQGINESALSGVEKSLLEENPDIFQGIPKKKQTEVLKYIAAKVSYHSGPLPSPETLQKYDDIVPGLANTIIEMMTTQTNHRIGLERDVVNSQIKESNRGQWMAIVIAISCLGSANYLGYLGLEAAASIIGGTTVVGLVGAFLYGKKRQENNLQSKQ